MGGEVPHPHQPAPRRTVGLLALLGEVRHVHDHDGVQLVAARVAGKALHPPVRAGEQQTPRGNGEKIREPLGVLAGNCRQLGAVPLPRDRVAVDLGAVHAVDQRRAPDHVRLPPAAEQLGRADQVLEQAAAPGVGHRSCVTRSQQRDDRVVSAHRRIMSDRRA